MPGGLRAIARRASGPSRLENERATQLSALSRLLEESGLFELNYYCLMMNSAGEVSRLDPIVHYLTRGAAEGLDPHPLFNTSYYIDRYPDVANGGVNPLAHYINYGAAEGRSCHAVATSRLVPAQLQVEAIVQSGLFDVGFYLATNPETAIAPLSPALHYVLRGAAEGRDPNPLFDTSYYLERGCPAGMTPLFHYLDAGAAEGRDPHRYFNTLYY